MVSFHDRFFTNDVSLPPAPAVLDFRPHPRIQVQLFDDWPMYFAVYHVDGTAVLKENMVDHPTTFHAHCTSSLDFQAFLIDYANALKELC